MSHFGLGVAANHLAGEALLQELADVLWLAQQFQADDEHRKMDGAWHLELRVHEHGPESRLMVEVHHVQDSHAISKSREGYFRACRII